MQAVPPILTVSSRMTITCPTQSATEVRVGSVHYVVTDASDNEVFKGVAPLPQEMVFRCPYTPARSDRNEILFSEVPDKTAGTLPITMTFHQKPDCDCNYGRENINYRVYVAVNKGEKARLFSYLLRDDGKPVMVNWQNVKMIPENNAYGFVLEGGKIQPTIKYYDAVYCRPASSPGWGPSYRIKGIRVELRKQDGTSVYGLNPWDMKLLATDTYPVDIEVVCK